MATRVERTSRYTVTVALPGGRRDATNTANALIGSVSGMPAQLVKTLTCGSDDHPARLNS